MWTSPGPGRWNDAQARFVTSPIPKMKEYRVKTLLLASAALGLIATPALAQKNHSNGKHAAHAKQGKVERSTGYDRASSRYSTRLDGNRNGILDRRERGYRDRDRDGRDDRYENRYGNRYGANNCPPGLAKKDNGCLPPGQAKRLFREGQRVPGGYNYYTDYSRIPAQYRDQYNLDPNNRYIYRDNSIYVVDPRTSLVERIIGSLGGL